MDERQSSLEKLVILMLINKCEIEGLAIVDLKRIEDERGFFARTFCQEEFKKAGLNAVVSQCNLAYTKTKGTLRGMHFQREPKSEAKFVRCVRGAAWDVAVDLRESSPTFLQHMAVELSAENRISFYIPEGFAHGYQTLTDDTELCYQVSEVYSPEFEGGVRYNDTKLAISWPLPVASVTDKDASWPDL